MVKSQEEKISWLKKRLEDFGNINEEEIGEIVEEYDNEFGNEDNSLQEKMELEEKIKILLGIDIVDNLPSDWGKQLDKKISLKSGNLVENLYSQLKGREIKTDDENTKQLSEELNKSIDELVNSSKQLEEKKEKMTNLLKEVIRDEEGRKLIDLEKEVRDANEEIKHFANEVKEAEKKVDDTSQKISEKIEIKKEELEKGKEDYLTKIQEKRGLLYLGKKIGKEIITGEDDKKKINKLLRAQEEITRHVSFFAIEAKEELLKELLISSNELKSDLEEFCAKQVEISQLEMQLEDAEKISKIAVNSLKEEQSDKDANIASVPSVPQDLLREIEEEKKLEESWECNTDGIKYESVLLKKCPFSWDLETKKKELLSKELPIKLYNIKKHEPEEVLVDNIVDKKKIVEKTQGRTDIKKYAILSYVCGSYACNKHQEECWNCSQYLYKGAKKSLFKSVKALEAINQGKSEDSQINYLWIDQLCIDQKDMEEKATEVRRMHQRYSNAEVTLVAIQAELGGEKDLLNIFKKVIKSGWFTRSWCYQEGWLSEQTIFMFDDALVDGRFLASFWILCQPSYTGNVKFHSLGDMIEGGSEKVATPLGWVYHEGYTHEDKLFISLQEILRAMKNRKRGVAIDGVYSILGLLPYGKDVIANYKPKVCQHAIEEQMDKEVCQHTEKDKHWPAYTKEDLEKALIEVVKKATENGRGEILAWYGENELSWVPEIETDNEKGKIHGSFKVKGGINIDCSKLESKNIFLSDNVIEVKGSKYIINRDGNCDNGIIRIERNFSIDDGVHMGEVVVKLDGGRLVKITLLGTLKTLNSIEKEGGDEILIPNKEEWKSDEPFAIIISKVSKEGDVYRRKGLVKLLKKESEKLKGAEEKRVKIGTIGSTSNSKKKQAEENIDSQQYQAQQTTELPKSPPLPK